MVLEKKWLRWIVVKTQSVESSLTTKLGVQGVQTRRSDCIFVLTRRRVGNAEVAGRQDGRESDRLQSSSDFVDRDRPVAEASKVSSGRAPYEQKGQSASRCVRWLLMRN